ncbi:MAG: PEP/pyruvate-binding domain-containing protein, partial [Anaerolineales bacterium]
MIIPLSSPQADLQRAGGKGANLARLTCGGFPIPPGFIILTDAYRQFVDVNTLEDIITESTKGVSADDPAGLEKASTYIRSGFSGGKVPVEVTSAIRTAYADLNHEPVAVRSSATLEDLPDLSFAGQQDTYLNIIGEDALLEAVVNCWSSLWTARAIGYRLRNEINHNEAALAVVVQKIVMSEVSGVLFTANPVTGLLSESVIDAVYGLGEALVSGQVEPDHFVVDHLNGSIVEIKLGAKKFSTRGKDGGGVEMVAEDAEGRRTLSDNQIHQLAALGQQVHEEFGTPQDIEWAIANGNLHLLQSRPITSLFPIPEVSFDQLEVWISFGAVQGLVGPITPLGRDAIQYVVVGAGRMFGLQLTPGEVDVFAPAGERLWAKISDLIRNPIGNRVLGSVFGFI